MTDIAPGWRVVDGLVAARRRVRPERLGAARTYLMLLPAVLMMSVLAVGVGYLIWRSVHQFDTFYARQGGLSTEQYRRLVEPPSGPLYLDAFLRTLWVSSVVTVGSTAIGLPVAYAIVRMRSALLRSVCLIALLVPFLMGEAVRAFAWSLILGREGAVTSVLRLLGLSSAGLMGTSLAITIGLLQVSIPLAALLILPAVRRIDPSLERAASTLGASRPRIWLSVIIPLARPGMAGGAAIVFLLSLAELDLPQVLGLGRLPFVANLVRDIYSAQGNLNLGSAFSVVLMVVGFMAVAVFVVLGTARVTGPRRRRSATSTGADHG